MSHITKLILHVVMNRVGGRTLQEIAPEQYGFMPEKAIEGGSDSKNMFGSWCRQYIEQLKMYRPSYIIEIRSDP